MYYHHFDKKRKKYIQLQALTKIARTTTMTSAAMPTPTWIQMLCDSIGDWSLVTKVLVSDTNSDDCVDVDVMTVGLYAALCCVIGSNRVFWDVGGWPVVFVTADVDWDHFSTISTHNSSDVHSISHTSYLSLSLSVINQSYNTVTISSTSVLHLCKLIITSFEVCSHLPCSCPERTTYLQYNMV